MEVLLVILIVVGVIAALSWWFGLDAEVSNEVRRQRRENEALRIREELQREGDDTRRKIRGEAREAKKRRGR